MFAPRSLIAAMARSATSLIGLGAIEAGTAYNPANDLGRVRLTARSLAAPVELFTIAANPEGTGGVLRLQWDRTELVAPFRVR
jgi:hypothetical protein